MVGVRRSLRTHLNQAAGSHELDSADCRHFFLPCSGAGDEVSAHSTNPLQSGRAAKRQRGSSITPLKDKVANVWCSLSVVFKVKSVFSPETQLQLSLLCTLLGALPSCIQLTARPTIRGFIFSLVNCALSFFLFSFQVHEKSVLLVSLPACLLLGEVPMMAIWFLLTSTFSMLPLLQKDGLVMAYVITTLIFLLVSAPFLSFHEKTSEDRLGVKPFCTFARRYVPWFRINDSLVKLLFFSSVLVMAALTAASSSLAPPPALPDLFPVLISGVSCLHFLMFFFYFNIVQLWDNVEERKKKKVS